MSGLTGLVSSATTFVIAAPARRTTNPNAAKGATAG